MESEKRYKKESKNRIIFLDIDGVLNTNESCNNGIFLLPDLVKRVNTLAWFTDSSIVISSTWRKRKDAIKYIKYAFSIFNFDADFNENQLPWEYTTLGAYMERLGLNRADFIVEYLRDFKIDDFVIIDDNDYFWQIAGLSDNVVQTNPHYGFTEDDFDKAAKIMGRERPKYSFNDNF